MRAWTVVWDHNVTLHGHQERQEDSPDSLGNACYAAEKSRPQDGSSAMMAAQTDHRWQWGEARGMRARVGGPRPGHKEPWVIRTALCQPREGPAEQGAQAVRAQLGKDPRSGGCAEPQWRQVSYYGRASLFSSDLPNMTFSVGGKGLLRGVD